MLNTNVYDNRSPKGGRFKWGGLFELGSIALNRYTNGEKRGRISFLTLVSSGTGHWPFNAFELCWITGPRNAWHVTVLGLCYGSYMVHNVDEEGNKLLGPDYKKRYVFFSCLNHKDQTLEEII